MHTSDAKLIAHSNNTHNDRCRLRRTRLRPARRPRSWRSASRAASTQVCPCVCICLWDLRGKEGAGKCVICKTKLVIGVEGGFNTGARVFACGICTIMQASWPSAAPSRYWGAHAPRYTHVHPRACNMHTHAHTEGPKTVTIKEHSLVLLPDRASIPLPPPTHTHIQTPNTHFNPNTQRAPRPSRSRSTLS